MQEELLDGLAESCRKLRKKKQFNIYNQNLLIKVIKHGDYLKDIEET